MAARADVVLVGLVWLNPPNVNGAVQPIPDTDSHGVQPANAQATSANEAAIAAITNQISLLRATRRR